MWLQICIIVCLLLAFIYFVITAIVGKRAQYLQEEEAADLDIAYVYKRIDCGETQLPCFINNHCMQMCSEALTSCDPQALICKTTTAADTDDDDDPLECNERHGIVSMLVPDLVTGETKFKCVSLLAPYIYSDEDELLDTYCSHGSVDFNFMEEGVDPHKCVCDDGYILYIDPSTNIPTCLNIKAMSAIPEFFINSDTPRLGEKQLELMNQYYTSMRPEINE
jgi:hypothetical protein